MLIRAIFLLAIFANFFGHYLVQYVSELLGSPLATVFSWNNYSLESIMELAIVFVLSSIAIFMIPIPKTIKNAQKIYVISSGPLYWMTSLVLTAVIIDQFLNINLSFEITSRGVGQFDRNYETALSRISLLVLPMMMVYRVVYAKLSFARFISVMVVFSHCVASISNGDRRNIIYYLIAFGLIKFRERFIVNTQIYRMQKRRVSGYKLRFLITISTISLLPIAAYYIRAINDPAWSSINMTILVLQSTFGALGNGAILSEVKFFIYQDTGFLGGYTFLIYIFSLFVPSAIISAFGGTEFYSRSSYLFNDRFNNNINQGYDFMMVADFFWNFGYLGYILFVLMTFFIARFVLRSIYRGGDERFIYAVLFVIFFVSGQRSDFGFFLKSIIYTMLFAKLYLLMLKSQGVDLKIVREVNQS